MLDVVANVFKEMYETETFEKKIELDKRFGGEMGKHDKLSY